MILPTEEALQRRRKGYQRRGVVCALAALLLVLSATLPHIHVQAYGTRGGIFASLIPASRFFVVAAPDAQGFPPSADRGLLGAGLTVTYLGLAAQQVGSLGTLGSFWVLAAEDVGRWTRRITFLSGCFLLVAASTVVLGWQLLNAAGVATSLGVAWLFTLLAGAVMAGGGIAAKRRSDTTWFWSRPDLIT